VVIRAKSNELGNLHETFSHLQDEAVISNFVIDAITSSMV
jgi:hypothetical protein